MVAKQDLTYIYVITLEDNQYPTHPNYWLADSYIKMIDIVSLCGPRESRTFLYSGDDRRRPLM